MTMRRFTIDMVDLQVGEGVEFDDGSAAVQWLSGRAPDTYPPKGPLSLGSALKAHPRWRQRFVDHDADGRINTYAPPPQHSL